MTDVAACLTENGWIQLNYSAFAETNDKYEWVFHNLAASIQISANQNYRVKKGKFTDNSCNVRKI